MQRPTFQECLDAGCSPQMAEILSTGQFPRLRTDTTFMAGLKTDFLTPDHERRTMEKAKNAGINTTGAVYLSLLGGADNPDAWVRGRGDVQRAARKQNLDLNGCAGTNKIDGRDEDYVEPAHVGVANDIVEDHTRNMIAENPGIIEGKGREERLKSLKKLKRQVKEKITPYWAK